MYIPASFQGPDQPAIFDFIEANSFGIVVSVDGGQPCATHLPLLLRRDVEPHGQLIGHMARANPHWREISGRDVLSIFSGPHAYISPRWYEADDVVPTWNYLAVHAHGRCELIEDEQATAYIVAEFVTRYERSMPSPWSMEPGTPFFNKMIKQIVAFRIDIARLEAKWKLSQNHPAERRAKVARQLAQCDDPLAQQVGQLMSDTLGR